MRKRLGTWKVSPSLFFLQRAFLFFLISIMTWIFFLLILFHSLCLYSSHKSLEWRGTKNIFSSFCSFKWFCFFFSVCYEDRKKRQKGVNKGKFIEPVALVIQTDTFPCFFSFSLSYLIKTHPFIFPRAGKV